MSRTSAGNRSATQPRTKNVLADVGSLEELQQPVGVARRRGCRTRPSRARDTTRSNAETWK